MYVTHLARDCFTHRKENLFLEPKSPTPENSDLLESSCCQKRENAVVKTKELSDTLGCTYLKMPGKKVCSPEQWEIMLNYLETNPMLSKAPSDISTVVFNKRSKECWTTLAAQLNSAHTGCHKNPTQWREYWSNAIYTIRKKARRHQQAMRDDIIPRKIVWTTTERRIFSLCGITKNDLLQCEGPGSPFAVDVDGTSSDSSHPAATALQPPPPPSPLLSTSSPPWPQASPSLLPRSASLQHAQPSSSPTFSTSPCPTPLPGPLISPTNQCRPSDITSYSSNLEDLKEPLQVAVLPSDMARLSFENINLIQNELQQRLWDLMASPSTKWQPKFEYCSKLEPFGLILKCCNQDALEWLTTTIDSSPFTDHELVVCLDTPDSRLPTTVNMCINITSPFEISKGTTSVFNVLVRTNKSWLDTAQWTLLDQKCSLLPPDLSNPARLCIVFSIPLSDVPKLREGGFKLHFLFGVVSVDYHQELKNERADSQETVK